ncbi:UDP-N-acetylglucosamine 1-carboxyvinyltransferase [Candidatus Purcelliella pentastirinorum]|uniref:UDP-N-acetylglucosamine 1-carboxyvinyltransferase n=1 Tax=Candidatus Purcelliella pentastirinorum TaxID=472834 RepID=UPI002367ADBD|nr:UDP-N-acetylglucosamine 1-carboxyvinyltransferase [Candidatus Purcelliella pentastirinorum]WDI78961.1 UDP-N-acetylglucosamine 1-carboxyvinyltransferase [Candidatus Purcelliella pentastirinorum]WDR80097.1 UDP-N-acetylglucosamine 1-carboxyvinyltransferase [Candidatus Purcelliella pentastirinorum]
MNKFRILGPKKLKGKIKISGSKNSALAIIFISLLTEKPITLKNVPYIQDIDIAIKILTKLGVKIDRREFMKIDSSKICNKFFSCNLIKYIRASIWLLPAIIIRWGSGELFLPGGCSIGNRPVDLHIWGLKELGVKIKFNRNYLKIDSINKLIGKTICFNKISVGATITVMSVATLAYGITIIKNAARDPEIIDIANFLNKLGAKIINAGESKIIIIGVKYLKGCIYSIMSDRIETGTFLTAAAVSGGDVLCYNTCVSNLKIVLKKLQFTGAKITYGQDWVRLNMIDKCLRSVNINTAPYPNFPTDMQSQFTLLNSVSNGSSIITENIFENRFMHVAEFIKMGARLKIKNNKIICHGVKRLIGNKVNATDLRSSISLVLAGCIADGITIVKNIHHIYRGYESIKNKLNSLGAVIECI